VTLVEVLAGVGAPAIRSLSVYEGVCAGAEQIRLAQEYVQTTQILAERMAMARLLDLAHAINLPGD
jgi:hypothetical protein